MGTSGEDGAGGDSSGQKTSSKVSTAGTTDSAEKPTYENTTTTETEKSERSSSPAFDSDEESTVGQGQQLSNTRKRSILPERSCCPVRYFSSSRHKYSLEWNCSYEGGPQHASAEEEYVNESNL